MEQIQTPPSKGKRILLVEDDLLIRELYGRVLRNAGYEVVEAVDGNSGYEAIKKDAYDLILLDIMLPGIDGLQILEKVTAERNGNLPPIVILTNLDQDLTIAKGMAFGIRGYLVKSQCGPEELRQEVENYLK